MPSVVTTILEQSFSVVESPRQVVTKRDDALDDDTLVFLDLLEVEDDETGEVALNPSHIVSIEDLS